MEPHLNSYKSGFSDKLGRKAKQIFFYFGSFSKKIGLETLKLFFDFCLFFLQIHQFIRKKLFQILTILVKGKSVSTKALLWRRGILFRPATHAFVIILSIMAVLSGSIFTQGKIAASDLSSGLLQAETTAETMVPEDRPRAEIIDYQVNGGDTISGIAQSYNVSVETVKWANNLGDVDDIIPGDVIKIPPVTGVIHKVVSGDTIDSVAKKYSADAQTIVDFPFNYIDDSLQLRIGQILVVPGGSKTETLPSQTFFATSPVAKQTFVSSGILSWPIRGGIWQYSSWWHPGAIDINNSIGTPILAADSGRVILAQKLGYGYGWHIVIDHGNGITTLYAHLSAIYVSVGQNVSKGEAIGALGITGRSTGPHLHFETRRNGAAVNPMSLLP